MNYLIFILIYSFLTNWFQIKIFFAALRKPTERITYIEDKGITELIHRKTGLLIKRFTIFKSDKPFGMMPGVPWKPEMILSSTLYETFNKDELEWVILHEAAHCIFWHVLKLSVIFITTLSIGILVLNTLNTYLFAIILAVILSLIFVQIAKYFEHEADNYAINIVDNPKGVISAQEKMKAYWGNKSENNLVRKYLHWNILPSQRIIMANKRLQNSHKLV